MLCYSLYAQDCFATLAMTTYARLERVAVAVRVVVAARFLVWLPPLPPFPEVVDYKENVDGTLTLFVDGVWPDYGSDYAFTNQIVVRPLENGAFRYLSNSIQKQELDIPVVGKR